MYSCRRPAWRESDLCLVANSTRVGVTVLRRLSFACLHKCKFSIYHTKQTLCIYNSSFDICLKCSMVRLGCQDHEMVARHFWSFDFPEYHKQACIVAGCHFSQANTPNALLEFLAK